MTERPTVVRSVNDETGARCVDIFRFADGTYGFAEFRRDPEDPRGWTRVGTFPPMQYMTEAQASSAAGTSVAWFAYGKE